VIDINLPPILHRLRDIAFEKSKIAIAYSATLLHVIIWVEGFPRDYLRKFYLDVNRWPGDRKVSKITENFN